MEGLKKDEQRPFKRIFGEIPNRIDKKALHEAMNSLDAGQSQVVIHDAIFGV